MDELSFFENSFMESSDLEERKNARRQRLQIRHKHAEKVREELEGQGTKDSEKPHLIKTIDDCNESLFKIFVGGKELVTNIRVSADTREIKRREGEILARNVRLQELEAEAAVASDKLNTISAKWESIHGMNDPLDLCQELKEQRDRCADLIGQKDDLISNLKEELKMADERYVNDRTDMWEDVCILAGRINEQVLVMKRSYFNELANIESAVNRARKELVDKNDVRWKELYETREQEEISGVASYLQMMETGEKEIQQLHMMHDEEYRNVKIKLDTDVQILEQELERIKAICLVNSEKLDYNYQVLKKREDENVIVKNNQKRTLNKLQDEATKLRKKIDEKDACMKNELEKLNKEVCRLHENILDTEKKSDYFSKVNDKKFQEIWKMKTKEANKLIKKINDADRVVHEEILGLKWSPPSEKPLKLEDLMSYKSALAMIEEISQGSGTASAPKDQQAQEKKEPAEDQTKLLKTVLTLVANNAGFLTEQKLKQLLKHFTAEEKTLVRLDNVFNAIGVQRKEEIDLILKYFTPYLTCNECDEIEIRSSEGAEADDVVSRMFCTNDHPLLIDKQNVLKALREYVNKLHAKKIKEKCDEDVRVAKDRCTISRLISNQDINRYWTSYQTIFPKEKLAVWEALHDGINKYYTVLQDRAKLITKMRGLKTQNEELSGLVKKYVTLENGKHKDGSTTASSF